MIPAHFACFSHVEIIELFTISWHRQWSDTTFLMKLGCDHVFYTEFLSLICLSHFKENSPWQGFSNTLRFFFFFFFHNWYWRSFAFLRYNLLTLISRSDIFLSWITLYIYKEEKKILTTHAILQYRPNILHQLRHSIWKFHFGNR